jgi:sigma-B regulation protein RsbU (phosphoserine phosphatase)
MMKVACHSVPQDLAHPSRGLARVNRLLCRMGVNQLVTAAWVHLDAPGRRFVYGAAGHPPLFVWRAASRTVEAVAEGGLLLGLMPEATYTQAAGVLHPGDRVLMYTDGVTEANGPGGEFFGQDRLASALAEGAGLGASAWSDQLLERLREWHGARAFDDDLTFVLVDVLDADAERRPSLGVDGRRLPTEVP